MPSYLLYCRQIASVGGHLYGVLEAVPIANKQRHIGWLHSLLQHHISLLFCCACGAIFYLLLNFLPSFSGVLYAFGFATLPLSFASVLPLLDTLELDFDSAVSIASFTLALFPLLPLRLLPDDDLDFDRTRSIISSGARVSPLSLRSITEVDYLQFCTPPHPLPFPMPVPV